MKTTITQTLETILDDCLVEGLQPAKPSGVELEKNVLIEDDSAGAGIGEDEKGRRAENFDRVNNTVRVKKELYAGDPHASGAVLAFYATAASRLEEPTLFISVNGHELSVPPFEPLVPLAFRKPQRRDWYYLPFSPSLLKPGRNEFIFYTRSDKDVWEIMISEEQYFPVGSGNPRAKAPGRSFKSKDGGKTWNSKQLGVGDNMRGEYNVRLNLVQFRPCGRITSGVLDVAADPSSPGLIARRAHVKKVVFALDCKTPRNTSVLLEARSGKTFAVDNKWSRWKKVDSTLYRPRGRFVQWQVWLRTSEAMVSPVFRALTISPDVESTAMNDRGVTVKEYHNERIIRSSYPCEYEKFDQPLLVKLRRKYKLDEVVAGAKTEWEKILKLKTWAGWQKARLELTGPQDFQFPDWNSHEILAGRGVFCLHHAILFMQACQAFGIQGRHVQINALTGSGHEVNEVWSNDYKKWVFIDPGYNYYVCDQADNIPLSLQELQAMLFKREKKEFLVKWLADRAPLPAKIEINGELPVKHVIGPSAMNKKYGLADFECKHIAYIFFMRIIPRNNFLAKKYPLPLNQGTSHWPWNGYLNWQDAHTPRLPYYSQYIYKKGDMYWTLNQAEFRLIHGEKEGAIMAHLDTVTPDFKTFEARLDGKEWKSVQPVFTWQLHAGINRLEVRPRNRAGLAGISSRVELSYLKH
jgi:hypothetical protein